MTWLLSILAPAALQLGLSRQWPSSGLFDSPTVLFVVVVIGAFWAFRSRSWGAPTLRDRVGRIGCDCVPEEFSDAA